jgi:hypothetical protein
LTRVLSSTISSTMCAASAKTAAVTMPARWCERLFAGWKRLYLVPSRPRFLQEARRARKPAGTARHRHAGRRARRGPGLYAAKGLYDQRHHLVALIVTELFTTCP